MLAVATTETVTVVTLRTAVLATFKALAQKVAVLGPEHAFPLQSVLLRCVSHNELFTDDTYVFSRAMKAFTAAGARDAAGDTG